MFYFGRHCSITTCTMYCFHTNTMYFLDSNGALPAYLLPSLSLFLSYSFPLSPSLLPSSSVPSSRPIQSHKEEEMQKSDNCIDNLVTKAQSSNLDEQFAAVQALRFTSSPCSTCSSCAYSHFPTYSSRKVLSKDRKPPINEAIE